MSRWRHLADGLIRRLHRSRVLRSIGKAVLRDRIVRQPFHGGTICLDAVDQSWAWTGTVRLEQWDRDIQDRLLDLSRDCQVMLDIGSNVGVMALAVALRNPAIRVVCVEPNARACQLLRRSFALNHVDDRMSVIEAVAAGSDEDVRFDETGSTTGHISESGGLIRKGVDVARLAEGLLATGRCMMKMDVEGFEAILLKEIHRIPHREKLVLVAELHARGFNGMGDPGACIARLRDSGATLVHVAGPPLHALDRWTDDLLTMQIEARWSAV